MLYFYYDQKYLRKTMLRYYIIVILTLVGIAQSTDWKYSSGDEEIDKIRREIKTDPTKESNFPVRALMLKLWAVSLQQQGAVLIDRYLRIDKKIRSIEEWNPVFTGGEPQILTADEIRRYGEIIDEGYGILEEIQREIIDNPPDIESDRYQIPDWIKMDSQVDEEIPWPQYKGNSQRTGYTGAMGPIYGRLAWKFPVGLAWESQPVVDGTLVYVSSPGMRHILFCIYLETGEIKWTTKQIPEIKGDQLYSTPCNSSTPIIVNDEIILREMGSRGNRGIAKDIVFVDKLSGVIKREVPAGHVDYRVGFSPVAANEKYLVFPYAIHDIEKRPPIAQSFNRIICKEIKTGNRIWDFNIGHTFAEPVLEDKRIYIGTQSGYVYALKADGKYPASSSKRIAWEFQADGPVNRKVGVCDEYIYFGSNSGTIYCLEKSIGLLVWRYTVQNIQKNAFRHFSTPEIADGKVFIGAANNSLYCMEAKTGNLIFDYKASDWIRSKPVVRGDVVYFASINGVLHALQLGDEEPDLRWQKRIGNHWIYADLTLSGDKILANDSDLYCFCIDTEGNLLWKRSLIKSFERNGERIQTDQIAAGAYYQSKPTAADGKVFIGTPSRFVYALNAKTGKEIWKYEVGAAVSASPVVYKDRIYFGQQGGEDEFYCLSAEDGSLIWTQNVGWVWGSANVADDLVFIPGIDGYVNCLDANDGKIVWRYRTERSTCSEPLVMGEDVFFGGWDHYLYSFNKATGRMNWKYQLSGGSDSGSPVGHDGKIFLPVGGHTFRCLDAKTAEVIWRPKFGATIFNVTPAYHDSRVFMSALHGRGLGGVPVGAKVYSVDAETGDLYWKHEGGGLTGPIVGVNGLVYFASTVAPYFYCVDEMGNNDGTTTTYWRYKMENKTEESTPALYNGMAFILCSGGFLHAVE